LQNITNFIGEKLVFSDLQAIRKECSQLKTTDNEKSIFQMQNAAEYERFEAEEALLKIQHEESKKNK